MRTIVIPQAFRIVIPPLTNELILLTKDSSLVYVLGLTAATIELTKFGRDVLNQEKPRRRWSSRVLLPADHPAAVARGPPHRSTRKGPLMTDQTRSPRGASRRGDRRHDLHKSFGENEVLKGIDFDVDQGEVVCVIGPSGSGKSTLLRCVNLLEEPTSGQIFVEGIEITDPDVDVDKVRRRIGMVFQSFNLFPHLTVLSNLTIAQRRVRKRRQGRGRRDRAPQPRARRARGEGERLPGPALRRPACNGWRSPGRCRWART